MGKELLFLHKNLILNLKEIILLFQEIKILNIKYTKKDLKLKLDQVKHIVLLIKHGHGERIV